MSAAVGDGVMAFPGVIRAICRDAADLLILRDLVEQIGQHRRIADMAAGDLDGPDLQRLRVDPKVDLAPDPSFGAAMLAGMSLTFALDFDARAVDQQVQWPLGPAIGDIHRQCSMGLRGPTGATVPLKCPG